MDKLLLACQILCPLGSSKHLLWGFAVQLMSRGRPVLFCSSTRLVVTVTVAGTSNITCPKRQAPPLAVKERHGPRVPAKAKSNDVKIYDNLLVKMVGWE